jgi:O-acetyl-ADP-ribose deacetylase (regulator of RNase III)
MLVHEQPGHTSRQLLAVFEEGKIVILKYQDTMIIARQGDLTTEDADAIVNAANSRLAGGGGVDGAVHAKGGPAIMRELDVIRAERGGCPTGQAVITGGGALPARYIIHTVGPVYDGRAGDAELLAACYRSSLALAHQHGLKTVAFPSISTGAYRYPIAAAAPIAVATVLAEIPRYRFDEIRFILFSDRDYQTYRQILAAERGLTTIQTD